MKRALLFDLHNHNISVSRNVVHHDHILPYIGSNTSIDWSYHTPNTDTFTTDHTLTNTTPPIHDNTTQPTPHTRTYDDKDLHTTLPDCIDEQVTVPTPHNPP
jgi:hypothetical protein